MFSVDILYMYICAEDIGLMSFSLSLKELTFKLSVADRLVYMFIEIFASAKFYFKTKIFMSNQNGTYDEIFPSFDIKFFNYIQFILFNSFDNGDFSIC